MTHCEWKWWPHANDEKDDDDASVSKQMAQTTFIDVFTVYKPSIIYSNGDPTNLLALTRRQNTPSFPTWPTDNNP